MGEKRQRVEDRGQQRPETVGAQGEQDGRRSAEHILRQIAEIDAFVGHEARRDEQPVPEHDHDRDPDHRPLGATAFPRRIGERDQQQRDENGYSHARHYRCRSRFGQLACASGVTSASAVAGHSLRS